MRFRIGTVMLIILALALGLGCVLEHVRASRSEARALTLQRYAVNRERAAQLSLMQAEAQIATLKATLADCPRDTPAPADGH